MLNLQAKQLRPPRSLTEEVCLTWCLMGGVGAV
jgi:hypothetical protein